MYVLFLSNSKGEIVFFYYIQKNKKTKNSLINSSIFFLFLVQINYFTIKKIEKTYMPLIQDQWGYWRRSITPQFSTEEQKIIKIAIKDN